MYADSLTLSFLFKCFLMKTWVRSRGNDPDRAIQERVLTGGNAGMNHVPLCSECGAGPGRIRGSLHCWTARWLE